MTDPYAPPATLGGGFRPRHASADDIDDLVEVELLSQAAPWSHRVFEKELALDFSRLWLVPWDEPAAVDRVAAYLVFWLVHDEVHVLNVVVHPGARRRGLARSLMTELVARASQQRASLISLEVRVSNTAARGLYDALGFVQIGRRPQYYADNGEDADVLALLLDG